jgi:hypothetical protein
MIIIIIIIIIIIQYQRRILTLIGIAVHGNKSCTYRPLVNFDRVTKTKPSMKEMYRNNLYRKRNSEKYRVIVIQISKCFR